MAWITAAAVNQAATRRPTVRVGLLPPLSGSFPFVTQTTQPYRSGIGRSKLNVK